MKELKEEGFLLDMGKRGNRLVRKEELLRKWVVAYPERLRPKLIVGRFLCSENKAGGSKKTLKKGVALWAERSRAPC